MKVSKLLLVFILPLILIVGCSSSSQAETTSEPEVIERPDLQSLFRGYDGTILIYHERENQFVVVNPERASQQFLPASTFKIPNSLIGLETGVLSGGRSSDRMG